nr:protein stoned-A [Leptinotarsa decemlineata]XP_023017633.1 protein stoned-A [Leptinotarsa decemlineata]XP_023017634.1 protein stoned-A [Leptinotarsa decemlineata]
MHKITKGLKKKKKGKKSKRKEEELFKPEELENYRREHQGTSEEGPAAQNEEWKKFLALTSGVDDILKKTQGDLDRIKSTSFFQRKPTESEVRRTEETARAIVQEKEVAKEEPAKPTPSQLGIVEVSESESEEDEDDGIFDTAYIDAIAAGEVKLAYIPESPTEKQDGDDPFDTSIAERAILGPEVERKGKKLVPLGSAVEVLTGRVQLPTCATKRPIARRQILKEKDLLLGSFDDTSKLEIAVEDTSEIKKTLLDEDPVPLPGAPIDLSNPIQFPPVSLPVSIVPADEGSIIDEFDVIAKTVDDDDIEFEALAAESLSKTSSATVNLQFDVSSTVADDFKWSAFEAEPIPNDEELLEDDPFDTTFAANILPDLKLDKTIFGEIQSSGLVNGDIDENLIYSDERISESDLNLIKPEDRDLLGGSNVDLSTCGFQIQQKSSGTNSDPFQTKKSDEDVLSDDEFDPRAEEKRRERTTSRPDILNISGVKTVSFDLTSPNQTALDIDKNKIAKPLTPFYSRKNSVPELPISEDPFDTSFATNVAPGKAELKLIESELFDPEVERNLSLVDKNFDPRDETQAKIDRIVNSIKEISKPKLSSLSESIDLLAIDNDISIKVLTPGDVKYNPEEFSYCDPFDTSIACNILPGKTELKILENELIFSPPDIASDIKIDDILIQGEDIIIRKPLNPSEQSKSAVPEDFDPFDTSCANNIQPGKAELKLLESELI